MVSSTCSCLHSYSSDIVCPFVYVCIHIAASQCSHILLMFALCTPKLYSILKLSSNQAVLTLLTLINFILQHC